jgi:hypothetical protein
MLGFSPIPDPTSARAVALVNTTSATSPGGGSESPPVPAGEGKEQSVINNLFGLPRSVPEGGWSEEDCNTFMNGLDAWTIAYTTPTTIKRDLRGMFNGRRKKVPWIEAYLSKNSFEAMTGGDGTLILDACTAIRASKRITAETAVTKTGYKALANAYGPDCDNLNAFFKEFIFGDDFVVPEKLNPVTPLSPKPLPPTHPPPATPPMVAEVDDSERRAERVEAARRAAEARAADEALQQQMSRLKTMGKTLKTAALNVDYAKDELGELLRELVEAMKLLPEEKTKGVTKGEINTARTLAVQDLFRTILLCVEHERNGDIADSVPKSILRAIKSCGSFKNVVMALSFHDDATIQNLVDMVSSNAAETTDTVVAAQVAAVAAAAAMKHEEKTAMDVTKAVIRRRVKNVSTLNSFMHILTYYLHLAYPTAAGAVASDRLRMGLKTLLCRLAAVTAAPKGFESVNEFVLDYYEGLFEYCSLAVPLAIESKNTAVLRRLIPMDESALRWYESNITTLDALPRKTNRQMKELYCMRRVVSTTKSLLAAEAERDANAMAARVLALEASASASQGKPTKAPKKAKPAPAQTASTTYDCRLLMKVGASPVESDSKGRTLVLDNQPNNQKKPAKWCATVAFDVNTGWVATPPEVQGKTSSCNCKTEYPNRPMEKREGTLTDTSGNTSRVTATGCVTLAGNMFVHSV